MYKTVENFPTYSIQTFCFEVKYLLKYKYNVKFKINSI